MSQGGRDDGTLLIVGANGGLLLGEEPQVNAGGA